MKTLPLFILLAALFLAAGAPAHELTIRTKTGDRHYRVEIADTQQQQERGLMHRRALAKDGGMLFVQQRERVMRMWMKDTPIPLDMLFIDRHGKIVYIAHNAAPNSADIITTPTLVRAVLELAGGSAKARHIEVGDPVIDEYFEP